MKLEYNQLAPNGEYEASIFNEKMEALDIDDLVSKATAKDSSEAGQRLSNLRQWFEEAVTYRREWADAAEGDYSFYNGKQWPGNNMEINKGRPQITINKIANLVNCVVGYQTQNRMEPDFLPRTADDLPLATIRKHVTKYILDKCDYATIETEVFQDACIGGIGWLYCGYTYDEFDPKGRVDIRRLSPFDVYWDPEAIELDLGDAEYIVYATWQSKGKVARMFPEHEDAIYSLNDDRDISEDPVSGTGAQNDPIWFVSDRKKIRLCTCWYKTYQTVKYVADPESPDGITPVQLGEKVNESDVIKTDSVAQIRCATFIQNILLEDVASPYTNGALPIVPLIGYYTGDGDIPSGIVRGIKDPQMEINKRRSQIMHIIDTTAYNQILAEQGTFTDKQKADWRKFGSKPGAIIEMSPGSAGKFQFVQPAPLPVALAQLEQAFEADLRTITGINEELLGTNTDAKSSGRAIELRQRSAVTQIALLFDGLRTMKLKLMRILWGKGSLPGLIQQFFTEPMMLRITENTEEPEFAPVNEPWAIGVSNSGQMITRTINDLTVGEFDIVITESPSTPTKRFADMLSFMELMKTPLGATIAQVAPDIFLEFSDIPNKSVIAERLRQFIPGMPGGILPTPAAQMQQQQQQQAQGNMGQGSQSNGATPAQQQRQADGIDAAMMGMGA
jgi:hypothetical protein